MCAQNVVVVIVADTSPKPEVNRNNFWAGIIYNFY